MPIITFESLDLVPDEFKTVAKAVDGGEGKVAINVVSKTTVDEFRDKNIALSKERDGLLETLTPLKALVGEDVEGFTKSFEELKVIQQRVKDGEFKESRAIEEQLSKRTEELRKDYDSRLQTVGREVSAWRGRFETLDQSYKQSQVASAIKDAAMDPDSGVHPGAVNDLIQSAYGTFRADDQGRVTPFEGDAPIYGSDGVSPMTPKEWLARTRETKPFFFKSSNGGGAGGSDGGTTKKVMGLDQKQVRNLTASQKLALANGEKI